MCTYIYICTTYDNQIYYMHAIKCNMSLDSKTIHMNVILLNNLYETLN